MKNKCSSCRYGVPVYIGDSGTLMTACVYILRKYERRPCPAGAACTVYEDRHASPPSAIGMDEGRHTIDMRKECYP